MLLIRDGKPVAAVLPIEDLEALEAEDEYWSGGDGRGYRRMGGRRPAGIPIEDIARGLDIDETANPDAPA